MQLSLTLASVLHALIMVALPSQGLSAYVFVRVAPMVTTVRDALQITNPMQLMETGAAGHPGANAMLRIRGPEPENATTLPLSKEERPVKGCHSKWRTAQSQ